MVRIRYILIAMMFCVGIHSSAAKQGEYVFPAVPDSIAGASDRAIYAVEHFWDNSTPEAMMEAKVMETFFYALGKVPESVRLRAITDLLDRNCRDLDRFSQIAWFVDTFIGTPDSIYRDDDLYVAAQRHIVCSSIPEEYKITPRWRIELLSKNKVGDDATDLVFRDVSGQLLSLYGQSFPCVLIFADSGCEQCRQEQELYAPDLLKIRQSGWNIIVVYLDGTIPGDAVDAKNSVPVADIDNNILENDLYVVRRLPSAYLIDSHKKIVAKEVKLQELYRMIMTTNSN